MQLHDLVFHHRLQIKPAFKLLIKSPPIFDEETRVAALRHAPDTPPHSRYAATATKLFSPGVRLPDAVDEMGSYFAARVDCGQGYSTFAYGIKPGLSRHRLAADLEWVGSRARDYVLFFFVMIPSSKNSIYSDSEHASHGLHVPFAKASLR